MSKASYKPSNMTDGDAFMSKWCFQCKEMAGYCGIQTDEDLVKGAMPCQILKQAFERSTKSPQFPKEWTFSDNGTPVCTAFRDKESPDKPYRCDETVDMFGAKV